MRADRIDSLDALRGVALCGILLMNLQAMGSPIESARPLVPGMQAFSPAGLAWWFQALFAEGTMRGLFSMLFGAGMLLFMAKAERGDASYATMSRLMLRRLFWLFVFGVANSTLLLWPGDILMIYAMAGLLMMPLLRLKGAALALATAGLMALLIGVQTYSALPEARTPEQGVAAEARAKSGAALTEEDKSAIKHWRHLQAGYPDDPEEVAVERKARLGAYPANLAFQSAISLSWFQDWRETLFWVLDAAAFMALGMVLFRTGWLQGGASPRRYLALVLVGYGVGVPTNLWQGLLEWRVFQGGWSPGFWDLLAPQMTYEVPRLLVTLGHLGLFHTLWRAAPQAFGPLRALGKVAFTGYLGQSALAALAFSGFGLGLWGRLDLAQMFGLAAVIWVIQILSAMLWLRVFAMGPLEWVWRSLTYGRPPPLLKAR